MALSWSSRSVIGAIQQVKSGDSNAKDFPKWELHFTPPPPSPDDVSMKRLKLLLASLTLLALLPPHGAAAKNPAPATGEMNPQMKKICETVSLITGVAISPLLGVGG